MRAGRLLVAMLGAVGMAGCTPPAPAAVGQANACRAQARSGVVLAAEAGAGPVGNSAEAPPRTGACE